MASSVSCKYFHAITRIPVYLFVGPECIHLSFTKEDLLTVEPQGLFEEVRYQLYIRFTPGRYMVSTIRFVFYIHLRH